MIATGAGRIYRTLVSPHAASASDKALILNGRGFAGGVAALKPAAYVETYPTLPRPNGPNWP
jgi:hypothetical protein